MKMKMKKLPALALAIAMVLSLAACGEKSGGAAEDIVNGDLEDVSAGNWVGWTREDAAFNFRGVVKDERINGVPMEKSGEYYFSGAKGGNPVMKGTLTSDVFKLGGNGFISFKIGAGKDPEKCYVEFIESGSDTVLAKIGNTDCDGMYIKDHLLTHVADLSAHVGKEIYIRITDNDDGSDYAYLNFDAFKVCRDDAEVAAAQAEYEAQIEKYGEKPFEEDETSTTIVNGGFEECDLENGVLTGWKLLDGSALTIANVVPTSQYYWDDRAVYGEGNYYLDGSNNGATAENLTGAIRSTKFTLGGDGYITFMMGSGNGGSYVALCDGNTDEELIKVENTYFSDPALALTLLRMYVDASDYIGRVCYMKVVDANDGSKGGFAFINVDDFRVSLTADEVGALEVEQMEKIQNETYTSASYDDLTSLRNYYSNYPYPVPLKSLTVTSYAKNQVVDCGTVDVTAYLSDVSASFGSDAVTDIAVTKVAAPDGTELTAGFDAVDMSAPGAYTVTYAASYEGKTAEAAFTVIAMADHNSVANGGFESGNLAGWTVLTDGWSIVDGNPTGVISAATYWGEEMPYNQAGNYHLDGFNTGIDEGGTWSVRSTDFTLAGSGFISVRMGGSASAVRVCKADGTEIGYYKQNRFNDAGFPHVGQGGSWGDMATYVMDLSDHIGEELYIVLCDEEVTTPWAHGFFDEVVTYYETAPDVASMADTVMDGHTAEEQAVEIQIPWQLADNLL